VRLADELGFDQVWAVEHHFLEEYSHCPAPELFLTACAMITKKIRVGHGIVICVPEFNHPIKIAERTAVLDILSGGRASRSAPRSATWTELGGFRANPDSTKKSWDEVVRCLPKTSPWRSSGSRIVATTRGPWTAWWVRGRQPPSAPISRCRRRRPHRAASAQGLKVTGRLDS
jgi:hypothetical protein